MSYRVKLTREVEDDLPRLYDLVLERRLDRAGGGDLAVVDRAIAALQDGFATLRSSPFTCRKADQSPFLRELVIPFGRAGHILFEIADNNTVIIAAARHHREDDYHEAVRRSRFLNVVGEVRCQYPQPVFIDRAGPGEFRAQRSATFK